MGLGIQRDPSVFKVSLLLVLFVLQHGLTEAIKRRSHSGNSSSNQCDFYKGSWVLDQSYPLYDPSVCPFIEHEFTCRRNGRPDLIYTKFRWQPQGCTLARYAFLAAPPPLTHSAPKLSVILNFYSGY